MSRHDEAEPDISPGPITILMVMVFFNFLSRGLFSPLLPLMERDFGIRHAEASSIFLIMAVCFSISMVFNGFLAARLHHRGVLLLYELWVGAAMILCAVSPNFAMLRVSAGLLGFGAGLYGPSGLASVVNLARPSHWGKALGIHEMGPNLGLIAAPLIAGVLVPAVPWRLLLGGVGVLNWLNGLFYWFRGSGGDFPGALPNPKNLRYIAGNRTFWILTLFFVLAAGSAMGLYSILPTFLISGKEMNASLVNGVIGASRIAALAVIFSAGMLADRFGVRLFLGLIMGLAGLFAFLLGVLEGTLLLAAVFLQPLFVSAFFPVVNTAISSITTPATRNVAWSMVIPFASAIGAGVTPIVLGWLGDRGSFAVGFVVLGVLTFASVLLVPLLRIQQREA
jgi:NNP family nitrate/nitrite transporter-like MFS transporter